MSKPFEAEPEGIDLSKLEIRLNEADCPHGPARVLVYYKNPETEAEYFGKLVFDVIDDQDPRRYKLSHEIGVTMTLSPENARIFVGRSKEKAEKFRVRNLEYGRFDPTIDEIECAECRASELVKRAAEAAERLIEYPELYLELERWELADRKHK